MTEQGITQEPTVDYVGTAPVQQAAGEITELIGRESSWLDLKITSDDRFQEAAQGLTTISNIMKAAQEARLRITRPLDAAKREVMDLFAPGVKRLEAIRSHIRDEMGGWKREKERQAEDERRRMEARAREDAEARRQEQVKQAVDTGSIAEAEALEAAPVEISEADIPPPSLAVAEPQARGVTFRKRWKFAVVDPQAVPRAYLMIDERALQAAANSQKENARVQGVKFWSEEIPVRTGR